MIGFPKPTKKKKRRHHPASKIHPKDGTCLLCMLLKNDYIQKITEEHHIFFGNPGRRLSEEHGLKAISAWNITGSDRRLYTITAKMT